MTEAFGAATNDTVNIEFADQSSRSSYDRQAAYNYAYEYWDEVCSDGYFWNTPTGYISLSPGTNIVGWTGYDCAHFVSCCIGSEPNDWGGGLPVPEEYPSGPWGISSSTRLYNWLIDSGNAVEVYSLAQLEKGDVISYDLNENGRPDHTVLYLGNGKIAAHTACYWNVNWDIYNPSSRYYKFVHIKSDTAQPDLVVEDIWVEPSEFGPGDTVKLWQRTKNIGGGDAVGTFRIQRYFDDVPISHADKNGLAADASYASWCSYTWPSDCSSHTVKVVADLYDAIAESDEGNNERSESFSAICEEVDLTVTSVNAPTSAQVGGYIAVSWTVRNQGTAASGSFYNSISLATTPYGSDIPLGNYPMNSIAAVSSSSDAEIPKIPETVSPGYYYVTVFADAFDDVTESDENNNINKAPDQIHITPNCGNMDVAPTSWSTTIEHGHSDSQIVTVSASSGPVKGVTVSKISGPTWLSVSPTNLGDIPSGSSKTFTMTASPPAGTSGDFAYTVRVSNTCGSPSSRDVTGTITVLCEGWSVRLDVTCGVGTDVVAEFGLNEAATDGFDAQFDVPLPPSPPPPYQLAYFYYPGNPVGVKSLITSYIPPHSPECNSWPFQVGYNGDASDVTITWNADDIAAVPANCSLLFVVDSEEIDMRTTPSYKFSATTGTYEFEIRACCTPKCEGTNTSCGIYPDCENCTEKDGCYPYVERLNTS